MATWREIGVDDFRAAVLLYGERQYRSSVSRFYYAAFSLLTHELRRKGVTFRAGRQTPAHAEVTELVVAHLTQFTEARRFALVRSTQRLYRLRLDAAILNSVWTVKPRRLPGVKLKKCSTTSE